MRLALADRPGPITTMTENDITKLRNEATYSRRLMATSVTEPAVEKCHQCGELLHPYPKPEYWMQYPLPQCCIIDGFKMCNTFRKPDCADTYLAANPAPAGAEVKRKRSTKPATLRKSRNDTDLATERSAKRDAAAAAVAASMPTDRDGLLAVAKDCVELYNTAVLGRADFAALVISERYEAVIWKLNGGTFFGSGVGDDSAGAIASRYCLAVPGEVPMWGQKGEFLITVKEVRCWVKYGGGLGSLLNSHFEFNAVDLDGPFISETGYRSHHCGVVRGQTVDAAAGAIFADFLGKGRRYLEAEYQDRRAEDQLPAWLQALPDRPRRRPAVRETAARDGEAVPDRFALVDVVLTSRQAFIVRKWAEAARPRVKAALREAKKAPASVSRPAAPAAPAVAEDEGAAGGDDPEPGRRYKIVKVHHPCFEKSLGKIVVIVSVFPGGRSVFAHDDRPVTYRKNRNGRMVVDSDPRCVQTVYSTDSLEPI